MVSLSPCYLLLHSNLLIVNDCLMVLKLQVHKIIVSIYPKGTSVRLKHFLYYLGLVNIANVSLEFYQKYQTITFFFFFFLHLRIGLLSLNFQLHTSLYIYLHQYQTVSMLAF